MPIDMDEFDAGLDAYQDRLREEAWQAEERSYEVAARPKARMLKTTFADLRPGDYMKEPSGPRWVQVVHVHGPSSYVKTKRRKTPDGMMSVMFEIPEPVTISGEIHYWIDRPFDEEVTVDANVRPR